MKLPGHHPIAPRTNDLVQRRCRASILLLAALLIAGFMFPRGIARADDPQVLPRVDANGVPGKLVICGGGELSDDILQRFVTLAGGEEGRLVVIPTAADDASLAELDAHAAPFKTFSLASIAVLHTRSQADADRPEFFAPLKEATGVWFGGGQQSRIAEAYLGTLVEQELMKLWQRGGVIGGNSAGAAIQSRRMIAGGNPQPRMATGFDLLPTAVIDQHFLQRNRKPRLLECLAEQPSTFGIGVDEGTAMVVSGRRMEIMGTGKVTICLPRCDSRPARDYELEAGGVADLVSLQRAVQARMRERGAATKRSDPIVPSGSLVLGGGGRMPTEVLNQFIEFAGGPEALIVILPTASETLLPDGMAERRMFERAGARNLSVLPSRLKAEIESAEYLDTLAKAGGIWFGGGRQWRFVDAYEGTPAIAAFHKLLERGGVIGGSSAGASIQAEYLVRGSPLGNTEMMAEGYERGFSFFPGVAVDQHFSQRNRRHDMESLLAVVPTFLGIGIDESTALIVRGTVAEVHGEHSVWFFDRSKRPDSDPIQVHGGQSFDLVSRSLLQPAAPDRDQ